MEKRMKALRIYVSNTDKAKHDSLYESIAFAAQRYGLSGVMYIKDSWDTAQVVNYIQASFGS